jgi:hypothetical protein
MIAEMKRSAALLFLSLLAAAAAADEKADAVGRDLVAALGGQAAWDAARQFQFDFVVENDDQVIARFSHTWDRSTGDDRLTGTDKAGAPFVVYFNGKTRQGQVFVNGRSVEGELAAQHLENAHERFINDTYWLTAPWKIFDPGVNRVYDGEKVCPGGGICDVLKLTFGENAGAAPRDGYPSPRDTYWLWISRDGHRMVQWQYVLNGAAEPPITVAWKGWQKIGGLWLSLERPMVGQPVSIRFENASVSSTRDDALFRPPANP